MTDETQLTLFSQEELGEERGFILKKRNTKRERAGVNPNQMSFLFPNLGTKEKTSAPTEI